MFQAPCAHRQEGKIVLYSLWYHQTYRWPSGAHKYIEMHGQKSILKKTLNVPALDTLARHYNSTVTYTDKLHITLMSSTLQCNS